MRKKQKVKVLINKPKPIKKATRRGKKLNKMDRVKEDTVDRDPR